MASPADNADRDLEREPDDGFGPRTVTTPAENAATVRDYLAKPRADWLEAATSLDALLAQAEAGVEWPEELHRQYLTMLDERDAAVRKRDQAREALHRLYQNPTNPTALALARAALTGDGTTEQAAT